MFYKPAEKRIIPETETLNDNPPRKAFIKAVSGRATQVNIATMLNDALLLKGTVHKHLMSPVAIAYTQPNYHPQIIYASASYGNLKKVLTVSKWPTSGNRSNYLENSTQSLVFSVRTMIDIASQVLKGVRYLHRN